MSANRKLLVEIVGDSKSYERAIGRSSVATTKFNRDLERVSGATGKLDKLSALKGLGAGLIASEVIGKASQFVDIASNLNEQIAKSEVVFGSSSKSIQEWSKTTAAGIGVAQDQALEAAGTFGNMTRSMGLTEEQSANLSQTMVNLAGDLASFNNASPEDTLLALRSAISGEYEPLRRYGSALSEARVQQQAMTDTGKSSVKELTNQEKVLARYKLIMKDTSLAQGDFARTSTGLANEQRKLAAQARELQASLGQILIPVVTELTTTLSGAAEGALALVEALGKIGDVKIDLPGLPGGGTLLDLFKLGLPGGNLAGLGGGGGSEKSALDSPAWQKILGQATAEGIRNLPNTPAWNKIFAQSLSPGALGVPTVGGPGAGGPIVKGPAPLVNVPLGFQNAILGAENANDRGGLTRALVKARQFEEKQLERALANGDTKAVNQIRSNIESLQGQIAGIYAEIAAETARDKADVKKTGDEAAAKAKTRRREAAQRLADALQEQAQEVAAATPGESDRLGAMSAIKEMVSVSDQIDEFFRGKADDIRDAALGIIDREQENADTSRALRDAAENLRIAKLAGGKFGIRNATEEFADARRARDRFLVEGASFNGGKIGATARGGDTITINVHSNQDPEAIARFVIERIRRDNRQSAPMFSGRMHAR